MGFVVLHMEKAHGSDSGTTAHIERFIIPKNADPTRTHLNRRLIEYPDGVKDRSAAIQRRLEEAGLTRKIGSNQVRAIRINVSGTHEDMKRIEEEGRLDEWCADNLKYFADTFGKENIVAAHLHRDEETPHIHVTLVPIVKGERKRRKREERTKKRYRKKPTDTVRLCADDIMTRLKLKSYQDTYAEAMAKYGLQRGIDGSKARHKSTQQYYRDIQKLSDDLKAEVVDLQQQKETAREELRRAKKEIQTEKLKGAATTAATNITESVGSLFGSNKVKTLEKENTALHREVAGHEETIEARKYSINSLVYWVTYVHNVVYSFYRSMIYCYINSTQRCAGSIVIDIIPTNGADKRKFFPFAPYFPVTNVIKRYFYPYFPAIIGIKGYSFPYFPYLSGIMKIKTALYSLFSRLDWHKTVVFPCLGEIYEGIRSLSWEIPVT